MTQNKMYQVGEGEEKHRTHNIAFHRGCGDENGKWCTYCAFERLIKFNKKCPKCATFEPHTHPEVLNKKPPKTKPGEFVTFSLAGEVSFMKDYDWILTWNYMRKYPQTTFLIQSKDPACFLKWQEMIPENCIVGTTIETNRNKEIWTIYDPLKTRIDYADISKAPAPYLRTTAMVQLQCRKAVTMEPILDFDLGSVLYEMMRIAPEFCYIGYVNDGKQGKRLKLPEPSLAKTLELIRNLENVRIDVRLKSIRKAWWEE